MCLVCELTLQRFEEKMGVMEFGLPLLSPLEKMGVSFKTPPYTGVKLCQRNSEKENQTEHWIRSGKIAERMKITDQ